MEYYEDLYDPGHLIREMKNWLFYRTEDEAFRTEDRPKEKKGAQS